MKGILGFLSFTLIVGGLQGLVHQAFDRWLPLMGFTRHLYLDGYEVYVSVVLFVLGVALAVAAARAGTPERRGEVR